MPTELDLVELRAKLEAACSIGADFNELTSFELLALLDRIAEAESTVIKTETVKEFKLQLAALEGITFEDDEERNHIAALLTIAAAIRAMEAVRK